MKALKLIYAFFAIFIIPIVIGEGVAYSLIQFYERYSHHWIAGGIVCVFSAAIVTWFPLLFLLEPFQSYQRVEMEIAVLIGVVGGLFAPLVFGFSELGGILSKLLILTTVITVSSMLKAFLEVSKKANEA